MPGKAFNIPLPTVDIPDNSSEVVSNDYIAVASDDNTYTIKNVPYVIANRVTNAPIIKNYAEYLYQIIYNVMYTDYSSIPYMRHLDRSLDSLLFDLMSEDKKNEIEELLAKKFRDTSFTFLGSDFVVDREQRIAKITCTLKYEGIIVNAQITKNVEEINAQTLLEVTIGQ